MQFNSAIKVTLNITEKGEHINFLKKIEKLLLPPAVFTIIKFSRALMGSTKHCASSLCLTYKKV